ncbi:cytochrome c oxidase assembly protein COX20, mitochondrial [Synchiropus splendidus]|uniref:cytochrome c oxidase assembly protein COX20, mitochondrial n=1 Tax=Synchiropus splendidus TaxID=270530 RepID=UPI00237E11F6|nr:cytochrome c oxidase assembly protein COX20, mitochondrial [Synchiropus splendidus]
MSGGDKEDQTGYRLLWILDVQKTPCAREAVLYGAGGSVAAGLLNFLATSRVRRSFNVGFAGFLVTTLGSWFYCRLNNARLRSQRRMIQEGMRNKIVYEGTYVDPNMNLEARRGPPAGMSLDGKPPAEVPTSHS